jgi:hypothetical protein
MELIGPVGTFFLLRDTSYCDSSNAKVAREGVSIERDTNEWL